MVDVGYTTAPGDYQDNSYASNLIVQKLPATTSSGTLQSLHLYMTGTGGGNVTIGLYTHDEANNRPGTLVATTASVACSVTNAYQEIATTTNPAIADATIYWIVFEHSANSSRIVEYDYPVTGAVYGTYSFTYGALPATWPGNILNTAALTIMCFARISTAASNIGSSAFSPVSGSGQGSVAISGSGSAVLASFEANGMQSPLPVSGDGSAAFAPFAASGEGTVTNRGGKIQVTLLGDPIAATASGFSAYYGSCAFVDPVTKDRVWVLDNDNDKLFVWTQIDPYASPTLIATITTSLGGLYACALGSGGILHVAGQYQGSFAYSRMTLIRSGDHITGVTSVLTPFSLPIMNDSLGGYPWGCSIAIFNNGNSIERVFITCLDGDDASQYCSAVIQGPITATSAADFANLVGTANSWTKFPTQTASADVGAPYCFNVVISRIGTSGNFIVVSGAASSTVISNYACSLVGFWCSASGDTWTVDTANPKILAAESYETMCGDTCMDPDGNVYFLWTTRGISGPVTVGLSKFALDGTFTANWISTTASYGSEIKGYPIVCSDGTVILALSPGETGASGTRPEIKVYSDNVWHSYWGASTQWSILGSVDHGSRDVTDGLLWIIGDSAYPAQSCLGSVFRRDGTETGVNFTSYSDPIISSSGGISVAPTYPDAVPDKNTQYVLLCGQKPSTANEGVITLPDGWTERGSIYGVGGYGGTLGSNTGNVNLMVGTLNFPTGDETPGSNVSVGLTTNNIAWAMMLRLDKSGSGAFEYASATGSDITGDTTLSVTYDTTVNLAPGDLIVIEWCQPTSVTTRFTVPTLVASGFEFGQVVTVARPFSTIGNGIGGLVCYARVVSGIGDATITFSAVAGGTATDVRGGSVLVRLREYTTPISMYFSAMYAKCLARFVK